MKDIVTGVAGFIGSQLAERLVRAGREVVGIDCFLDYYPRPIKEGNLSWLRTQPNFAFREEDLLSADLNALIGAGDRIFHQAAQAGVRASWGRDFAVYSENNIRATQVLLEACKGKRIGRLVYASSSSIYGDAESLPTREDALPQPVSPYGVSKLAAEHLCRLYWRNFGVPSTSLRYFTVYGPRHRPDMAFHRLIRAALRGETFTLFGSGEQSRDFTFVDDIVTANLAAADLEGPAEVLNVGGGSRVSVNQAIAIIEELAGTRIAIVRRGTEHGDVTHTAADTSRAAARIGYRPSVDIRTGLAAQVAWQRSIL
jgi:UDP-glucose 4-epimerase